MTHFSTPHHEIQSVLPIQDINLIFMRYLKLLLLIILFFHTFNLCFPTSISPILGDSVIRCSAGEKPAPEKRAVQASDLQSDLQVQEEEIQLEEIVVHHSRLQANDQPVQLDPEIPPHYMTQVLSPLY
ncbi:hypothetical protein PGT21_025237 [Puccinia graminis f. sp. tritici]|uniref:Uncharacterized protein n=1 Tax=Puccinia graminis f. sp. tritici TaxID=56615 RepID=A0A5B0NWH6_PUCGR|nr:hypothetical protein PGT21_025237 [Puccinia graminis f. sp. tritici]